jgi:hypothetical protein
MPDTELQQWLERLSERVTLDGRDVLDIAFVRLCVKKNQEEPLSGPDLDILTDIALRVRL